MASSGRGSGVVGYDVQVAVDIEHHLIVAHEVTNSGSDRAQLANIVSQAKAVLVENSNVLIKLLQEVLDYKPRRGDNRPARDLWLDDTAYLADRRLHLVAGDLQDELLAGFGAHAARVSLHAGRQITGGKPQQAHFFAWYTPVRAASPPQAAHPVNLGFFVSMPTRRPFSVPT